VTGKSNLIAIGPLSESGVYANFMNGPNRETIGTAGFDMGVPREQSLKLFWKTEV
jgi:hypothetical protein